MKKIDTYRLAHKIIHNHLEGLRVGEAKEVLNTARVLIEDLTSVNADRIKKLFYDETLPEIERLYNPFEAVNGDDVHRSE